MAASGLAVVVGDGDFIAEELRRLGAGVRDQCLFLAQLQLEVIMQELGQAGLGIRLTKAAGRPAADRYR